MNWLDLIGACLSLIATYYFTQAKRLAWLVGLGAVILNSLLYWQKGIYGHLILEIIYAVSMIYGWLTWSSLSSTSAANMIRSLTLKEALLYTLIASLAILSMGQILIYFTDSNIPYWDATSTILSLFAQWLLCLKVIHCWIVWFIVDLMIAGIQLYKGIPCHSIVHWIYLSMAVLGYWKWQKLRITFNSVTNNA